MATHLFAVAALALAPAAYSWWTGRRILRSLDDPTLPELVFARTRRTTQIACAAIVATAFLNTALLAVGPAMVLALLAVQYPVRRAIFEDSWSFASYLRYMIASLIPSLGFWLFAMFAPTMAIDLARSVPPSQSQWQLAVAATSGVLFALVLLFWHHRYSAVWLALHQGSPLATDPRHASLLPRFTEILDRSRLAPARRPTIHRYGAKGGRITNAIALVSLREPAVAMSDTLLDSLDANEATAIFAHEIAHHEHYDVAKLRKARVLVLAIAVLLAVLPPAMFWSGAEVAVGPVLLVVPLALFAVFAIRISRGRAHETESDLRAVELTGDPEAVISALTKIHWLARLPRRWGHDVERSATHPSLARRIQAIRARGAAQSVPLGTATVVRSAEGNACVVLADDRSYWFDGVPADAPLDLSALRERAGSYRAVAYGELTELHLVAGGSPRMLRATDLAGKTWKVAIRDEDVARVQATLDVVDGRLGVKRAEPVTRDARIARVLAAGIAITSLLAGFSPVVALAALVPLFVPTAASLAATSAMAAAWFAVIVTRSAPTPIMDRMWAVVALLLAAGSAFVAWRLGRFRASIATRQERLGDKLAQATLAMCVVVLGLRALPSGAMSSRDMLEQPAMLSLAIAVGGLGAALLLMRRRWERITGGSLAALAVAGIGAVAATERLWPSPSDVAWTTGRLSLVAAVPVDRSVYDVDLSPLATRYLAKHVVRNGGDDGEDDADDAEPARPYGMRFTTGSFSAPGATRTLDGVDAAMVGEDRILVLTRHGSDSLELRLESLAADGARAVRWRETLPAMFAARLRVSATSSRWRLSGRLEPRGRGRFVTLSGALAGGDVRRVEIDADTLRGSQVFSYEDGTTLLSAVTMDHEIDESSSTLGALSYLLGRSPVRWTIWRYDGAGRELVATVGGIVNCGGGRNDSVAVCVETAMSGTRAWSVSRAGGPANVATISRQFEQSAVGSGGLVVTTSYADRSVAVVDVVARRGVRASVPTAGNSFAMAMRATPEGVVALVRGRSGTQLALYRLEPLERVAAASR